MTSTTVLHTIPGHAEVYRDGRHVGEVRRVDGRWRAVPLSRVAHASSSGCPSYRTRREAADALATGQVTL